MGPRWRSRDVLAEVADDDTTVQAMKAGAVEFLTKPVRDQTLLDAVNKAIAEDLSKRESAPTPARTSPCSPAHALASGR